MATASASFYNVPRESCLVRGTCGPEENVERGAPSRGNQFLCSETSHIDSLVEAPWIVALPVHVYSNNHDGMNNVELSMLTKLYQDERPQSGVESPLFHIEVADLMECDEHAS